MAVVRHREGIDCPLQGDQRQSHNDKRLTLFLCDQGCGGYDRLVVNGPAKGSVWSDGLCADSSMSPLNLGFFDWYERWLDQSFKSLEPRTELP